jgi:amino acid transporter
MSAAISMGVGAMVGAGIFALLGEAGSTAGNAVYLSFVIAGLISLLSGYSYAKLGARYPSSGGIVEFLAQAYGGGYLTGILSILLYLSVTVVMALVARAFGSYAKALIAPNGPELWVNLFASAILVSLTIINAAGSELVGRLEKIIVFAKLSILVVFVAAGFWLINPGLLFASSGARSPLDVLGTVAVCLLAYHGFGVITNTVEDMPTPSVTLPRAIFGAIGIVMVLYVGVAVAVFGNLPLTDIVRAKDYAMAEAARPVFGQAGFTVVAVAALLSAASSINANLYSTAKMTYLLARDGDLPQFEARKLWHRGTGGLFTTAALVLLIANLFDLTRIATLGSIVYLIVYCAVHLGHWKYLTSQTGASRMAILIALFANGAVLVVYGVQTAVTRPFVLYSLALMAICTVLVEVYMQTARGRTINSVNS